jgi:hypothetical protein
VSDCATSSVSSAQQAALQFQIGVAVARQQQDAAKVQGDAVIQLLQAAAALSKSTTSGGNFDAQA